MLILILILALLIGLLRGGKITNIMCLRLRHVYLVFFSVIIDLGLVLAIQRFEIPSMQIVFWLVLVQYILLFLFLWFNKAQPFMWVVALGTFLNFIVIIGNGGAMPLSQKAVQTTEVYRILELLNEGKYLTYTLIGPETRLWFLGDVIYLPKPVNTFVSIGDILLFAGIFLLIQHIIAKKIE